MVLLRIGLLFFAGVALATSCRSCGQDCHPGDLHNVHPKKPVLNRNEPVGHAMRQGPQLQAAHNQWNRGSFHLAKNGFEGIELHQSQQQNVRVVPEGPPGCLIDDYLGGGSKNIVGQVEDVLKQIFAHFVPHVAQRSVAQEAGKERPTNSRSIQFAHGGSLGPLGDNIPDRIHGRTCDGLCLDGRRAQDLAVAIPDVGGGMDCCLLKGPTTGARQLGQYRKRNNSDDSGATSFGNNQSGIRETRK